MSARPFGILAGMGPRSTAPFIDLVVDECQRQYGARHDIDFPQMLVLSHPTPFFLDRPIDHQALKDSIVQGLRRLEACGVSFIAMPCNSAHAYFEELRDAVDVPVLNIVDETLALLPQGARATLLATPLTFDCQLYQSGIRARGGEFYFRDAWQLEVTRIICDVKAGHREEASDRWQALIADVRACGCDAVISACTDLNAAMRPSDMPVVDSAQALAQAVVRTYLGQRA